MVAIKISVRKSLKNSLLCKLFPKIEGPAAIQDDLTRIAQVEFSFWDCLLNWQRKVI